MAHKSMAKAVRCPAQVEPMAPGQAEWLMVTADIEGGRSIGVRAWTTDQGGAGRTKAEGRATGSSCPKRGGSQQVQCFDSPLKGGTEGLIGCSDNWVVGMAGYRRRDCRDRQILRKHTSS